MSGIEEDPPPAKRAGPIRWLLLVPFAAMAIVPFYNRQDPALFGIPFFYWYQLVWTMLGGLVVGIVYRLER